MLAWQMDNDQKGAALADGLIQIAKKLDLKVIAEGVETQSQVDVFKELGCDYQEGFYYSSGLDVGELIKALSGAEF
jgi:EAL domain-containing protein (putative c-di-GMP-specific phosphodiesterase class I)